MWVVTHTKQNIISIVCERDSVKFESYQGMMQKLL